jgi:hypothetical protein
MSAPHFLNLARSIRYSSTPKADQPARDAFDPLQAKLSVGNFCIDPTTFSFGCVSSRSLGNSQRELRHEFCPEWYAISQPEQGGTSYNGLTTS